MLGKLRQGGWAMDTQLTSRIAAVNLEVINAWKVAPGKMGDGHTMHTSDQ